MALLLINVQCIELPWVAVVVVIHVVVVFEVVEVVGVQAAVK
jgi:hypothetical protein